MARIPGIDSDILPLSLGGNPFGWTADAAASHAILDAFAEAGGSFVDTADMYSHWVAGNEGGESEQIIGDWMASRNNRDDVVVATKAGRMEGLLGLADATVNAALDASLRRLRTDRVDLFYAHGDDPDTPIEAQVRTFDALVRASSAERYLNADGLAVVDALARITGAHGVQLTTVALAWLLAKGITAPIASVSRPEQLPALMAAATLQLSADEVAALDDASAPFA